MAPKHAPPTSSQKLDGAIASIQSHRASSGAYAIFLSQRGTVMIYHAFQGELRGVIAASAPHPTPNAALQHVVTTSAETTAMDHVVRASTFGHGVFTAECLAVDPSGIYVAVAVPEALSVYSASRRGRKGDTPVWSVLIFEVAGADKHKRDRIAGAIHGQARVRACRWSTDGMRITVATLNGIGIWRLSKAMHTNVSFARSERQPKSHETQSSKCLLLPIYTCRLYVLWVANPQSGASTFVL